VGNLVTQVKQARYSIFKDSIGGAMSTDIPNYLIKTTT
jgi:uncharacterized protein YdeI (BOF family)